MTLQSTLEPVHPYDRALSLIQTPPTFRAQLDQAIAEAPCSGDIPMIGYDQLDLKDAQAAALISVLADIIEAVCVLPSAVPTTHAAAA
jgi:hypothetical protein